MWHVTRACEHPCWLHTCTYACGMGSLLRDPKPAHPTTAPMRAMCSSGLSRQMQCSRWLIQGAAGASR